MRTALRACAALMILVGLGGGVSPTSARDLDAVIGESLFDRVWTVAGASNRGSDGLGPLFNARACVSCHAGGGAGELEDGRGLVLRFPDDPHYGRQLQTGAVQGQEAEGGLAVSWRREERVLDDGTRVELRAPVWRIEEPGAGPVPAHGSLRLAPSLAGLGQVETALGAATQEEAAGRGFGLKADHASLAGPVREALLLDLGLSTPEQPAPWGDCTALQPTCRTGPHGVEPGDAGAELSPTIVNALLAYLRDLPAPRPLAGPDPEGERLFMQSGCAACHQPRLGELVAFSDYRSHDLGEGLADGDPADPQAAFWRTAPLWGLGRKLANGGFLLHDGRARDATEAILWHGGEAEGAVAAFSVMPAAARARLLKFLEGL
ncbi:di-heme oxidoredictase family protein [Geminicoccus roseus]|uniref:di-heme oxidoredictase family protein n=1 Tax=Geminicoccus roseus TaxID=404900 RepID=UPI0003FA79DF|nr:di-heme oxidoredictase family protein [Geminicoccus roseus]